MQQPFLTDTDKCPLCFQEGTCKCFVRPWMEGIEDQAAKLWLKRHGYGVEYSLVTGKWGITRPEWPHAIQCESLWFLMQLAKRLEVSTR